jgi:hypothetical protein
LLTAQLSKNYLSAVLDRTGYSHTYFSACGIIVSDEELFVDNAEEYIRRDIEGSDVDTRRRAACDLVRVLSRYFEGKITEIFGSYVQVCILVIFRWLYIMPMSFQNNFVSLHVRINCIYKFWHKGCPHGTVTVHESGKL